MKHEPAGVNGIGGMKLECWKGLSTFPRPNPKKSFIKKPRRAVAEWKAPNRDRPPTAGSVGRMWSIQAPNAKPECSANEDCPQAFHALRAAANEKQPSDPKRSKNRDALRVQHSKRTNWTRRSLEDAKPARTLSNPLTPRFHPTFDDCETQLLDIPDRNCRINGTLLRQDRSSHCRPEATPPPVRSRRNLHPLLQGQRGKNALRPLREVRIAGRIWRCGKHLQAYRREPIQKGGMPLIESGRQRPARSQMLY